MEHARRGYVVDEALTPGTGAVEWFSTGRRDGPQAEGGRAISAPGAARKDILRYVPKNGVPFHDDAPDAGKDRNICCPTALRSVLVPSTRLTVFPAFLKVADAVALVVGGGPEAAAKVRLLGETSARVRLVALDPCPELAALVASGAVEHVARPFVPQDVEDAVLVFAASGDPAADGAVAAAARARRVPVNAVDQPALCDFYTPALVNRAPVAVAIGTTGAGPVLAQRLRAAIEIMLPARLGALAALAASFRSSADAVLPKGRARRRFWSAFFDGPVAAAALAGRPDE
ncbi:precorrin-2 dehydrogenase/sirohydrochlorin ferrochelatase family protein, partial [Propylenella binzhouense]